MRLSGTPRTWAALLLAAGLSGCAAGPRVFVNPQADMSFYKKVAVLPFGNLSPDRFAGERVTRAFITELVLADRFQVVEPADFAAALDKVGGLPGSEGIYDPEKVKLAMTQIGATGLVRGAVNEYSLQRSGSDESPVLSFDVELVDVATGAIVWRASITRQGRGRFPILGGSGTRSFSSLVEDACAEVVRRLEKEAF
ncbi:MAG TPA: hypothetical protein VMS93_08045 [Candidatus Saccharimonadales bacterium]|nr:hypothetical protein [Candidatus Saccharimonadales bacterium]